MLFDFNEFIARIEDYGHRDMVMACEHEVEWTERLSYGVRASSANRDAGSVEYLARIGRLRAWLKTAEFPSEMTNEDRAAYRRLCQRLIDRREFRPGAMDQFDDPA